MEDSGNSFQLKSVNVGDEFEDRNKDVFGGLTSLEDHYLVDARKRSSFFDDDVDEVERNHDHKCSKREFKRPDLPTANRSRVRGGQRKTPDYVVHPYSWTKYSLRETGEEHMSETGDSLNKKVALEFLQKNKTRNESEEEMTTDEDNDRKMVFKIPLRKQEVEEKTKPKTSISPFVDNVHKMPEYVVGKEKRQNKKSLPIGNGDNSQQGNCLELHHLDDDVSQSEDSESCDPLKGQSQSEDSESCDPLKGQSKVTPPCDDGVASFKSVKSKGRKQQMRQRNAEQDD